MSEQTPQDQPQPRRGGARAGAGRKVQTSDGGPMERITLTLDRTTIEAMREIGGGGQFDLSEGIRRAARAPDAGRELADAVLAWWDAHQYDTMPDGEGGEYNVYDTDPEFVAIAMGMGKRDKAE